MKFGYIPCKAVSLTQGIFLSIKHRVVIGHFIDLLSRDTSIVHSTSNLGRGRMSLKGGRWHERTDCDFEDNAFGELREGKDFTDVTLACEDGQQVEAHKVVLTSSSPFF